MDSDGNMHCFLLPLSSCYIEISAVSQCRILWLFSIRKHSCLHFFFRLTPCTCWTVGTASDCSVQTVTWSLLTLTDADWTCWLTADAQVGKHKHECETDSDMKLTQTASTHYTVCPLPTNSTLLAADDDESTMEQNSCSLSSYLTTTLCTRHATYKISRNCPIRTALTDAILKALFVANSKVSTNASLNSTECMFCSSEL